MVIQGVIRPPPEIRAVADRTALYVAKNGRAFEARILGSAKGNTPKFAFLHSTSPFHAYYEQRIQAYENGEEDAKDEKKEDGEKKKEEASKEEKTKEEPAEAALKGKKTQTASAIDPVAKIVLAQRSKIAQLRAAQEEALKKTSKSNDSGATTAEEEEDQKMGATVSPVHIPPPRAFHFVNIIAPSSLSLDQIEKIQLVAQFTALDGKQGRFLSQLSIREWNNPGFAFCQPRHGHFAYFSALVDAYRHILERCNKKGDDGIKELANNAEKCLEVAAYRAEYERDVQEQASKNQDASIGVVQIDWHDFVVVETIDFAVDEVVEMSMLPPPPPSAPTAKGPSVVSRDQDAMDEYSDEEEDEPIRVVPSYTPKIVVGGQTNKLETVIDPITGKSIPIKDMPEHMRIQLLDPKWAEERKKFQEKQKDSNLVGGDVVASNLERLAQARGGTGEQSFLSKESDPRKRLAEANRIIRDQAQPSSVGPSLPAPPPRPHQHAPPMRQAPQLSTTSLEPAAKRPRVDNVTMVEAPPQVGVTHIAAPPPPPPPLAVDDPFASAGTASSTVSPKESSTTLLSASEFAASLSKPEVTLQIRIPNDRTQMAWNFYGQVIAQTPNVMSTVKAVKQELARVHLNSMPANKIQLKCASTGMFLKDNATLAALNIGPTATLELVPRARGGRK